MKLAPVHSDIRKAETLDKSFYLDESCFALSRQRLFARTWQWAGDVQSLHSKGQLLPFALLPGFMDEPLVLVCGEGGRLHAMSNVCTHRGNVLVEHPCTARHIVCRYHGRRFNLQGRLEHMPEFDGVENFPADSDHLPQMEVQRWGHMAFVNAGRAQDFAQFFSAMQQRMHFLPLHEWSLAPALSREYLVKAHWALYCENYLEGFHIPFVHPGLNAQIEYNSYTTELYALSSLQLALARQGEPFFELPKGHSDFGKQVAAFYWWVFPNMMFNFYPWGLSVNVVKPLTPSLTRVSFLTYVSDPERVPADALQMLDKVEREDEAVVEQVQRGIRSSLYQRGRYSPTREAGTHHFHCLITRLMNGEG